MQLGERTPYRNDASGIWHAGTVEAVRRTPNPADGRTFTRLSFPEACGRDDTETITAALVLQRRTHVAHPSVRCAGCYTDGQARDTEQDPDAAPGVDNWREALERQGDMVWFCRACRSHTVALTATCPACGGGPLEAAPPRHQRDVDSGDAVP